MGAHETDPGRAALGAGPLRVARLCPLPIGVLAWRAPEPTLTVVVKATFVLGADGTSTLAAEQEPLSLDRPAPGGAFGELDRASDFVPLKARVDVLLTGHARSDAAMCVLPAGFAVDKLRRRFYATTEEPSEDDEATRTLVHLPRASDAPDRAPLLVLGGLRGALASFEAKVPPGRPQRPAGLQFGPAEDSTGVAIGMTVSPQEATAPLSSKAPARQGLTTHPRSRGKR